MTDNRTNEPTPEQVEAAAVSSINSHRSRAGLPTLAALDGVPNADEWRDDARAALEAAARTAQGATPQAESEDNVTCRCGHGTGSHDFSDPQEPCREIVCDCRGWFGVSPVLPSSGVDEDKLAEVIGRLDWGYMVDGPSVSEIARAVVEWLEEQG